MLNLNQYFSEILFSRIFFLILRIIYVFGVRHEDKVRILIRWITSHIPAVPETG